MIFATADSTSIQLRLEGTVLASRYGVNTDKGIFTPTKETPFVAVQDKGACLYNKVTKEYCYSTGATKYYPTNEVSPESITLNKTEIRTEFKENIYSLVATLSPDNVNINDKITWTTSDDTIAQVFKGGDVVILGPKYGKAGECTITATTANGKTATCNVTVVMEAKVLQLQTKNYLKQV